MGFKRSKYEPCVFSCDYGHVGSVTIGVHVDDLLITSTSLESLHKVRYDLQHKFKEISYCEDQEINYLGMTIKKYQDGSLDITAKKLIEEIIKEYDIQGEATSPASGTLFKVTTDSDQSLDNRQKEIFHSRVMKLLYLCKRVRPDLLLVESLLSTRVTRPCESDWQKLSRALKDLNGTSDKGLHFQKSKDFNFTIYLDAAHNVHDDSKGQSGMVAKLGDCTMYCRSVKQKLVSMSSFETELIALSDGCNWMEGMRNFLIEMKIIGASQKVKIYQDNRSTILAALRGPSYSKRTKHINVRFYKVKELVDSGILDIEYKQSGEMVADILTKPLQGTLFRKLRSRLLGK